MPGPAQVRRQPALSRRVDGLLVYSRLPEQEMQWMARSIRR
jgi:hypothetical protein